MNKGFFKYIFKLAILALILWGLFMWAARGMGMHIYDEEYASYKQTMDYINKTDEYNDVLIFGDSVAKAGIIPELISDKTYNISMAGATTIEQYYMIQDYLQHHEAPKTLVVMYFVGGYDSIDDFFWNRTIYFNCLTTNQFKEIVENGAFENNNACIAEFLQYKLCLPNKYFSPIKNALFSDGSRYELNKKEYQIDVENKGQHFFGTAETYEPNNVTITGKQNFKPLPIIDLYMDKCIELCEDNGIKLIIEQPPINASTFANTPNEYKEEFKTYMRNLAKKYPNIIINTDFNICPGNWLGDFSHLNENGATNFTKQIKEKYSDYLK